MSQGGFIPNGCAWFKRLCVVGGLMLAPLAAQADFVGLFPKLTVVVGVAADDTLNIREAPSPGARDIGDLKSGQNVEILETDPSGKWARILHEESSGWVSTRFLVEKSYVQTKTGVPLGLTCGGTEPFWGASLNTNQTITFEISGLGAQTTPMIWTTPSRNRYGDTFALAATDVHAVLRRAACSDGMSDRDYGWAIDVLLAEGDVPTLLSGCCSTPVN